MRFRCTREYHTVSDSFARTRSMESDYDESTGFAVVGEYADQTIKDAQTTAYGQMLKWLQDH